MNFYGGGRWKGESEKTRFFCFLSPHERFKEEEKIDFSHFKNRMNSVCCRSRRLCQGRKRYHRKPLTPTSLSPFCALLISIWG